MSKGMIKAAVLTAVAIVSLIVFSVITNKTNNNMTIEMAEATLPTITLYYQDEEINELYGYVDEMNPLYMRDDITPIHTDRILPIRIHADHFAVDSISYEIRSMDMERLISNTEVENYKNKDGVITAELEIQNLLEENEEYLLMITLVNGDREITYYTRIIEPSSCYVKESIDFVQDFHRNTFDSKGYATLATYMEPQASADNTTLAKVSINSTLRQVAWADFEGEVLGEPNVSVKEINPSYNVLIVDYVLGSVGDGGEMEYYNVEEYYRVRHSEQRMYLLNFEREMNQIFRAEDNNFYENYIQLGIRDSEVEYMANETGTIVCFTQEGELWSYNATEQTLSQVFSFRGYEGIEARENHDEHDVRIIKVDETGSTDFVVYGYMNRGVHEGQVGVSVYHYDSVANTVEEELFIPSTHSYEVLKSGLGQLVYENEAGMFYIMLGGTLYEVNLADTAEKEIISGLDSDSYAASASNRYIAYIKDGKQDAGTAVEVLNLEDGSKFTVEAAEGRYIRPLGFMGNDFIYGEAEISKVYTDQAGNTLFPMDTICIIDTESPNHELLKEYHEEGYYIESIEVVDYTIYLNREKYNGMTYVPADQDTIMNREGAAFETVSVHADNVDEKQTQIQLAMNELAEKEAITSKRLLTPKQILLEESRDIKLTEPEAEDFYYAYARGRVVAATNRATEAIAAANENMGVVVGSSQQYIWKRARKTSQSAIEITIGEADAGGNSIVRAISGMLQAEDLNVAVGSLLESGSTPKQVLKDTMQDAAVLDLTGSDLEAVLYYVNRGTPVFAMTSDTQAVLVVGYDSSNVTLYNPATGENERKNMEDAQEMFAQAGSIYFAYLK